MSDTDNVKTIKKAMIDADRDIGYMARRLKISETYTWMILNGRRTGYKHRAKIARMLKRKKAELFPDRNGSTP